MSNSKNLLYPYIFIIGLTACNSILNLSNSLEISTGNPKEETNILKHKTLIIEFIKHKNRLLYFALKERRITNDELILETETLDLSNCNLESCKEITAFKALKNLNLANNNLLSIGSLKNLKKLEKLNVSNNGLCHLGDMASKNGLKELNLSRNHFISSTFLSEFKNLKKLDLSYNKMVEGISISCLDALEELDVSHNNIIVYPILSILKNLRQLNLSHNGGLRVDAYDLSKLRKLEKINLQATKIDQPILKELRPMLHFNSKLNPIIRC